MLVCANLMFAIESKCDCGGEGEIVGGVAYGDGECSGFNGEIVEIHVVERKGFIIEYDAYPLRFAGFESDFLKTFQFFLRAGSAAFIIFDIDLCHFRGFLLASVAERE